MAETLTVNAEENSSDLTAEEQDSLQVGEKLVQEQGELLAGKYKNAEDLEKAYIELQKKLGDKTDGVQENQEATQEVDTPEPETKGYLEDGSVNYDQVSEDYGAEVGSLFKNKGIDPYEMDKYFNENNGTLSEEMYSKLESAGFNKSMVDSFIAGKQAEAGMTQTTEVEERFNTSEIRDIQNTAGGEEQYNQLIDWVSDNLPEGEINAFNELLDTGNKNQIKLAVQGMNAKYIEANGYEGRMLAGKPPNNSGEVFRSQAQLVQAMSDPRYDSDPAYRADVIAKLDRSDLEF
mgnify:FL=1|tara:strand:- start:116 stop:988 length:873 start_codon:yes stop_codon:yes gene_type:complete